MRQFRDPALFRNDLLTEYAKHYQPWGLIFFYYVFQVIDPLLLSKILPVGLLVFSPVYLFKLVKHLAQNAYAGGLAAFLFMTGFTYVDRISGGISRSFAFPLLILFLYFLVRKDYLKSSLTMMLQCLFFPTLFPVSALTYLFTFLRFDKSRSKIGFFIWGILLSVFVLGGKYILDSPLSIGQLVTREQMTSHPEYYEGGQYTVLPTAPVAKQIGKEIRKALFTRPLFRENRTVNALRIAKLQNVASFAILLLILFFLWRTKFVPPLELAGLFLASVAMYQVSDFVLMKLFVPRRYPEYSIPLLTLILFALAVGKIFENRKFFKMTLAAILILLNFHVDTKEIFINQSGYADVSRFLKMLPKETLIAAHPELADALPAFAQRKVFIQFELSHPFFDRYWETIKKRTFDFFDAYYAEDPESLYQFLKENQIHYLVVVPEHFKVAYLQGRRIYFEPFNTYVKEKFGRRTDFALRHIPEKEKLFSDEKLFVIRREGVLSRP